MSELTNHQYLRDLVYLDWEKAASIYSQLQGGLPQQTQEALETSSERRAGLGLNLGVLKPELSGVGSERVSTIETRVLHHDVLLQIENALEGLGAMADLVDDPALSTPEDVRASLRSSAYVRAEGWVVLEDYQRMDRIAEQWAELQGFIQRSAREGLEETPELQELRANIESSRLRMMNASKQQRSTLQRQIRTHEKALEDLLDTLVGLSSPPAEWIIEGLRLWIRVFLPERITVRVFPLDDHPEFQLLGNLKRDSFVDADIGNLLFAYGTRPNLKLTILGLVTSLPEKEGHPFDSLAEFSEAVNDSPVDAEVDGPTDDEADIQGFERGFRKVFHALDGLDAFARFSRYPNVTVYPLAVYRRVQIGDIDS